MKTKFFKRATFGAAIKLWELLTLSLKPINQYLLQKYSNDQLQHQPIFIIGAPRTGSTIIYQSLTNQLDVLYVDNLTCRFNKVFFIGFWLSNMLFKNNAHNCFKSKHGNTNSCGFHAPSECGAFWYRWLPKSRHFIDFNDLDKINLQSLKAEITAISNYFKKHLIFKNLNAGQRMRLISRIFPDAKFIFVRRDPFFTAQSILQAKRKVGIPDNQFWSIMPSNVNELKELDWAAQIVLQIYYLEKQIAEDVKLFPKENIFEISYLDLNQRSINQLINRLDLPKRINFEPAKIDLNEKITINKNEIAMIQENIEELDWANTYVK